MIIEKFSREMTPEVEKNSDAFEALCPRSGTERLNFKYGDEQHSATIHSEGGETVLIYDGILEL